MLQPSRAYSTLSSSSSSTATIAPQFCRGHAPVAWWKVFNPQNRYTNDNLVMIAFGNVGFMYFDRRRKYWMGAAMWSTLLSICFTIAGCFALSTNMVALLLFFAGPAHGRLWLPC